MLSSVYESEGPRRCHVPDKLLKGDGAPGTRLLSKKRMVLGPQKPCFSGPSDQQVRGPLAEGIFEDRSPRRFDAHSYQIEKLCAASPP